MVNILANQKIIEELLQESANPKKIAEQVLFYLNSKDQYTKVKNNLKMVQAILTPYGATANISEYIYKYLTR